MIAAEPVVLSGSLATPSKIQGHHFERLAAVYLRQSTPQQVLEHRESTALQYALRTRAIQWGWPAERVLVIDDDLGYSGTSIDGRVGFQRLLAEISLDHVGLVLGIEMSRLARCNKDWHQLLELCALFGTLLADQDGLYDPRNYNDRLLLGLKGTLSEAELHLLHQRMHEGMLNKARRGELFNHPPMGYVRLASGELAIDPDQQVQDVIRLIFQKFDQLGTISGLLQYLARHQIRLPVRPIAHAERDQLQWRRPNRPTLNNLLHHPLYAGAYSWGRRPIDPRCQVPGRPSTGRKVATAEQCQVLIQDRCPAYITWPQYQANLRRIAENRSRYWAQGAPREGPSLLGGLLVCGRCGCRMMVSYGGRASRLRYSCLRHRMDYAAPNCQGTAGRPLDALIETLVLQVLQPASLELSLAATADLQAEQQRLEKHWQQRLERAGYDVNRAARQYHAVEPENRLVARELEKRWEQTLLEQRTVQEAYDRFRVEQPGELTEADRAAVRALATDLPALWHSPQATAADRQQIIRHLIERVVLTVPMDKEIAEVRVHWAGGCVSRHELVRPVARYEHLHNYPALAQRIADLHQTRHTAPQIAAILNAEGWRPPKRRATFNGPMVLTLLSRQQRRTPRPVAYDLKPDEWWFADLADALHLPQPTLYSWMRRGWVNAKRLAIGQGRWLLWADAEELDRLQQLRNCPKTWYGQPQAADLTRPKPWPQDLSKV